MVHNKSIPLGIVQEVQPKWDIFLVCAADCCLSHQIIKLFEVAVVESLKSLTVTSLVLSHLVYGVVDSDKVVLLCEGCDTHLILTSTSLGVHTLLEVSLGIPYAVAQQLCEL